MLRQFVAPLGRFSSWVRGCECHEADRMAGKTVTCSWAGCRAPRLASRFEHVLSELDQLRHDGAGLSADLAHAASSSLGSLDMKMGWTRHTPYTIWQASWATQKGRIRLPK